MANVGQENTQRNRSQQPLLRRGDCETPREDSGRLRLSPRRRDAKMVRVEHRHATSQGRTIEEQDYPEGRQLPHRISDLVVPTSMGEWIRTDRNRGKAVPPVRYESKRIEISDAGADNHQDERQSKQEHSQPRGPRQPLLQDSDLS